MTERIVVNGMSLKRASDLAGLGAGFDDGAAARSPDLSEPWTPEPLPVQKASISNGTVQAEVGLVEHNACTQWE